MKRFAAPLALFLAFVLVIGAWFVGLRPRQAAGDDRRLDGLYGGVLEVTLETAPLALRFGEWVEAAGSLESSSRYDRRGRLLEVVRYRLDNAVDYRVSYRYEGERLLEETSYTTDEAPLYRWLHDYDREGRKLSLTGYNDAGGLDFKTVYSYDPEGRLVQETAYNPDETLSSVTDISHDAQGYTRETRYGASQLEGDYRTVERYDRNGNRLEEAAYGADGALQYRVSYRYDGAGRLLEEIAYGADSSAQYRLENRYDEAGNLLGTTEYDADDEPFYRYGYAYDEHGTLTRRSSLGADGSGSVLVYEYDYDPAGNWVTRRAFKELERFGETVLEPSEVSRRDIQYADEVQGAAEGER